jgi:hypothetical protein
MIEIAQDNHIDSLIECTDTHLDTIKEFITEVECCTYDSYDCDIYYACKHNGKYYYDPLTEVSISMMLDEVSDEFNIASLDCKPDWATHIKWSSK